MSGLSVGIGNEMKCYLYGMKDIIEKLLELVRCICKNGYLEEQQSC